MADWANGYDNVVPGKKLYIFTGESAAAREELIERATQGVDHVVHFPDPKDFSSLYGTIGETTAFVLRHVEDMTDWSHVDAYLSSKQIKGYSLVLSGSKLPEQAKSLKSRTAVRVDVSSPKTEKSQKDLVQWVGENWKITTDVARMACERSNWDVGTLMWATKIFKVFSDDKPVVGQQSKRMVEACTPVYIQDEAYMYILYRHRTYAAELVKDMDSSQRLGFFRRLEAALTDLQLLHSVMGSAKLSAKTFAHKTGLHIVRVLELITLAPRYNPSVIIQCRQALQLGLQNYTQPESAVLVAMIWG
jgi:hypothetical protein